MGEYEKTTVRSFLVAGASVGLSSPVASQNERDCTALGRIVGLGHYADMQTTIVKIIP